MNRIRGKLTYSNVMVTTLAVIVLGGGTAYAATAMLPKNSVGAKQIKKGAVTPAKLSKGAKRTLVGPSGPQGKEGPSGPQGTPGPQGPGAVSFEAIVPEASTSFRTFNGIEVDTTCKYTDVRIELHTAGGTRTLDVAGTGTVTAEPQNVTFPIHEDGVEEIFVNTVEEDVVVDLMARNTTVSKAFAHFNLSLDGDTCQLWAIYTPSAVG